MGVQSDKVEISHYFARYTFFTLLFLSFTSCAQVKEKAYNVMLSNLLEHNVQEQTVSEFQANIDSYQILDSRSLEEYKTSHIKDAIWVGYDDFQKQKLIELDSSKPILVYCSVGYRSEKITQKLDSLGFENVSNLYGGIFEWANEGLPIYKNEMPTDTIHAYDKEWGFWLNSNYVKRY